MTPLKISGQLRQFFSWPNAVKRGPLLYVAGVLAAFILLFTVVAPLIAGFVESWGRSDVALRARTINASARDQVVGLLRQPATDADERLQEFFAEILTDERLAGVAVCNRSGTLRIATQGFPVGVSCDDIGQSDSEVTTPLSVDGRTLLASSFPLPQAELGHLVVVHDLTYALSRAGEARLYLSITLGAVIILATGVAGIISWLLLRSWQNTLRGTIADLRAGRADGATPVEPMDRELREALEQYDLSRRSIDGIHVDWNPDTLRNALVSELPGAQVIAISNREPYIHNRGEAGIKLQIPASGLVAALEPVVRACGGTWIAHGSGSADRDTVDAKDRVAVPPADPSYTLRRVWLSAEEQEGYYYGLANEGLWPLCHIAFVRPSFREEDWQQYKAVNEKFADAIVAEARCADPIVLIQDYHFALLPKLLRQRLPKATSITFWHIPWPNAETFSICPWKEEIIEGLLGSSILGFHTHFHCNNFIETVDRFVESRIDREHRSVVHRGNETLIRPYPISIEWPPAALAAQRPVEECRAEVKKRFGIADHVKLGVGMERFDYTKGILDRMRAIDALLRNHPEWHGRVTFIQGAAPTRDKLTAYQALQSEAATLADEVNAHHGSSEWKPIILSIRHHEPDEVFELYRAADFCIVSSLHDGMNLVAKEFVAARDDERGVLILSTFAGASRELSEALIVNPYHTHEMAEAMHHALAMPAAEQQARMRQMRALVRSRNVYRWAGQMLLDAASLRRRGEIEAIAATNALKRLRATSAGSVSAWAAGS
jgi:trehalose 6-phosphate synthase